MSRSKSGTPAIDWTDRVIQSEHQLTFPAIDGVRPAFTTTVEASVHDREPFVSVVAEDEVYTPREAEHLLEARDRSRHGMVERTDPCPTWCTAGRAHSFDPHEALVGNVPNRGFEARDETQFLAVMLWRAVGDDGLFHEDLIAIDTEDGGYNERPAVTLSSARARSLAAALLRAADRLELLP